MNTIHLGARAASTAILLALAAIPANAANYELASGFDPVSNPGAVWSCGWFSTIGGEFQTLTFPKTTTSDNGVALRAWQYSSSEQPVVNWNGTTNVAIVYGGLSSFAPGDMFLHPGPDGSTRNFGGVRFTLPLSESGLYRIETAVAAVLTNGPASDTDFYVVKNGREVVGWVLPAGEGIGYTNQMQLAPGETVDFLIGRGADEREYGGALKLRTRFVPLNVVTSQPPVIVAQPQSRSITVGGAVSFSVAASGTPPITYQWLFNGSPVSAATNAAINLSNVQFAQAGSYAVTVANMAGSVTSSNATLTVNPPPIASSYDLSRDFSATNNPNGVWSYGSKATFGGTFSVFGYRRTSLSGEGVPISIWEIAPAHYPDILFNGTTNTATSDGGQGVYPPGTVWFVAGEEGQAQAYGAIRFTVPAMGAGQYRLETAARSHLTGPSSGDTDFHVVRNGVELFGVFLAPSSGTGYTNLLALSGGDTVDFLIGRGQDGRVYGSGLKVNATLTLVGSNSVPPVILAQPESRTVTVGSNTTFTVSASGTPPLTYRWLYNGSALASATNSALTLNNVQPAQAGNYRVVVANVAGSVTSVVATLTVTGSDNPVWDMSSFSAATNPGPVWSYGWVTNFGGKFQTLTFAKSTLSDNGLPLRAWQYSDSEQPLVNWNSTTNIAIYGGLSSLGGGEIVFYPGPDGTPRNFCVIRLTVPSGQAGTYRLESVVTAVYTNGPAGDTDYHIAVNGMEIFGRFLAAGQGTGFTNQLTLSDGDTVDFLVGRGADGQYYGDGLKIRAKLFSSKNVVEPPVVVPPGLVLPKVMKTNDAAFGAGTLANAAHRSQQVYAASQFGGVAGAIAITELRFRPDYYYGKSFSAVVSNLQISLSTTLAAPEALSATFSNNVGTDATTVFSGALSVSSSFSGPTNGPKAFDIVVPLQTPFVYQPSRGNLLVDTKNFSGSSASLLSGEGVSGDGAARVLGGVNAPSGVPDIGCDALLVVYTPTNLVDPPVVVPPGLVVPNRAVTNDLARGSGTLVNANFRVQEVYGASQFSAVTGAIAITELRLRPDYYYGKAFSTVISNLQISLSTTPKVPGALSTIYSNNIGADATVVFNGSLPISSQFSGPGNGPKAFDMIVPLQTPFVYDPSRGSLLVDVKNFSGSTASLLSGLNNAAGVASRVIGSMAGSSGTPDIYADALLVVYTPTNVVVPPVAPVFDISDFSATTNPGPVWSYGWFTNIGGTFTLLTYAKTAPADNGVPINSWQYSEDEQPVVAWNGTTNIAVVFGGQTAFPPGSVWFHPGPDDSPRNLGAIRFTMPAGGSGNYWLESAVAAVLTNSPAGDTDFHIAVNGMEIFGRSLAAGEGTGFTNQLALSGGDTVDFLIGRGADGQYYGDGLKIRARLFSSTNVVVPPVAPVFDISDFSATTNPGPVWSYGWFTDVGGEFQLLPFSKISSADNGVRINSWQYSNTQQPVVAWNGTTNIAIISSWQASFAPGSVWFHAGTDDSIRNYGAIRLTVPDGCSGIFRLESAVEAVITNSTASDTDFHILENGIEVFSRFLPAAHGTGYTNAFVLNSGDTIDFLVGRGQDGHEFGGGLKIRAKLFSPTNVVVPPVVVPPGLVLPNRAVTNDLARGSGTLANSGYRVQDVYGTSQFGGVTGAIAITELRFRPDYYYGKAFSAVISNLQISLSTTLRQPGALSPVYSNNIGADARTVFSGSLSVSSAFSGPEAGPKAFDIVVPLQTPFVYEPAKGNLLVDVKNSSGSTASLLSGLANSLNEASRVGGGLAAASGTADNYADALLLVFTPTNVVVPPVVPPGLVLPNVALTNDAAYGSGTLANPNFRVQEVYGATQFGGVTGVISITELRFRPDYYYGKAFSAVVSNIQMTLSTTMRTPGGLSSVFSNNVGANVKTVFNGSLNVASSNSGPTNGPKAFDIIVRFQTPFVYDSSKGNLLLDVKNFSGSTASFVSGMGVPAGVASRVTGGATASSGSVDRSADAIQIIYSTEALLSPAPHLGKFERIVNEQGVLLSFDAASGDEYRIEASTNLVDWVLIDSVTVSSDGPHSVADVNAANYPSRFYRVIVIPKP